MFDENKQLTKEEINSFKKDGYDLSEDRMYIIKFLFNDQWNNAADPRPFRIKTELVKKLADDAIGMPYVVNPNGNDYHVRGTTAGKKDTVEDLLKVQINYAIGEIKAPIIKSNNNVYGVIEIWKEFEKDIENMPIFTSPTIFVLDEDTDGVKDAQFLNINAVNVPGYPEYLSGISGVCKGGIKKCMSELAPLGAAGKLIENRKNPTFLNTLSILNKTMSAPETKTAPTIEMVAKDVEAMKGEITNINTKLDTIASKVGAGEQQTPMPPIGAAGEKGTKQKLVVPESLKDNEFVKTLIEKNETTEKLVSVIQKEREKEKTDLLMKQRQAHATSIVERLIADKKIAEDKKEEEIKKYMELKNEDGSLKDLELLDNFLKSQVTAKPEDSEEEILGASGYMPLKSDKKIEISNMEVMEAMRN